MKKTRRNYPYKNLILLTPAFDTKLTSLIIDLNILREKRLSGSTPPSIFFQLKHLFHVLESLGSARIEGNHTTLLEFIESKIDTKKTQDEGIKEIENVEKALAYIDEVINHDADFIISEQFIKNLHSMVVKDLTIEGDKNPGQYRKTPIGIGGTTHKPPRPIELEYYMEELIEFINTKHESKYDLLKVALAHHRFVWVHPFGNGNGRTVRLLTYAQLVRAGFRVDVGGRIINPTAVFCSDRSQYYQGLANADTGTNEGLSFWCEYVLEGLKEEIEKIDKLTDYKYLSKEILIPALEISLERELITKLESEVLKVAIKKEVFEASDIAHLFAGKSKPHISRFIRNLKSRRMINSETKNGRKYTINFDGNYLIRGVIMMLDQQGFLPPEN